VGSMSGRHLRRDHYPIWRLAVVTVAVLVAPQVVSPSSSWGSSGGGVRPQTDNSCPVGVKIGDGCTATFEFTGGSQTFTVPDGITTLQVEAAGGYGGGFCSNGGTVTGGAAGGVNGDLTVTEGQTVTIVVGGVGANGLDTYETCPSGHGGDGSGGFGGGGAGGSVDGLTDGGGGGATTVLGPEGSTELVAGGGGGEGAGSDTFEQFAPAGGSGGGGAGTGGSPDGTNGVGSSHGPGGGGGTTSSGGAGGPNNTVNGGAGVMGQPGSAGAGGAGGAVLVDCGDPACVPPLIFAGGGGGGGFFGGGGGGGAQFVGSQGAGGGSSFAANDVVSPTFVNKLTAIGGASAGVPHPNGEVSITYEPPCSTPLAITTARAERDTKTGDISVTLIARINPIATCGEPKVTVASTRAARGLATGVQVVAVTRISGPTSRPEATATRDLSSGDSCWVRGLVRLSQATATATAEPLTADKTVELAPAQIETATATRSAKGVALKVEVDRLAPNNPCGHANLRVDSGAFTTLLAEHLKQSGGTLTAHAVRPPAPSDCKTDIKLQVIPRPGTGSAVTKPVKISGGPPTGAVCV